MQNKTNKIKNVDRKFEFHMQYINCTVLEIVIKLYVYYWKIQYNFGYNISII